MRRNLFGLLPTFALFAMADTGGASGNPPKTLKDQLTDAQARIAELEPKSKLAEDLQTKLTESEGKVTKLEGEAKTASETITKLQGEAKTAAETISKLQGEAKTAGETINKLEGAVKTAEGNVTKIKEHAAKHGITGIETDSAKVEAETQAKSNGEALYAEYSKLSGRAKTAFFAKNETALMAYAEQLKKGE